MTTTPATMPGSIPALLERLARQGCTVKVFADCDLALVHGDHGSCLFTGDYHPLVPESVGIILTNRFFVLELCRDAGIPVPAYRLFRTADTEEAREFARSAGYPVILKPAGARSAGATITAESDAVFRRRFNALARYPGDILVEQAVSGIDLKVFISDDGTTEVLEKSHGAYAENTDIPAAVRTAAAAVLSVFSPMPYICFGCRLSGEGHVTVTGVTHDTSLVSGRILDWLARRIARQLQKPVD